MGTVYLRNVPDDVVERLERLAARERVSVNTYAMRELAEASRRADNADLLGALPDLNVDTEDIVSAVNEGRESR
ncbi:antitoxin [Rhodococcus erythropolis]|uniref:FitA-like ribbon-helix-helix domain-containing protein n=1 Tax=Rhodococcus erythropolis TaxID=1833 RepID=UPI001C9A9877|nr:antitoxin [Rhodococcus erythropolis]MBY6388959.1 antitoxin [Rhodococcus erythropolis]